MTVDSHPSVGPAALREAAIRSLSANRIAPKFLYVTPEQTALWREVFLKHSPIHGNPEFARIYREAFVQTAERLAGRKVALAGLGCGTGVKETALSAALLARGCGVVFSAVDVSRDLVIESAERVIQTGARHERSLVAELGEADFLGEWLAETAAGAPRVMTFFGLIPNFAPSEITVLFRAILRPGDVILASAHLVPVAADDESALAEGMAAILPQYRNPETLAWLAAAVRAWELDEWVGPPEMNIGEIEGVPAFIGSAPWLIREPLVKWGCRFPLPGEEPLRLFSSLRHTPARLETWLRREGFAVERLAMTSCRQEAIWSVRRA